MPPFAANNSRLDALISPMIHRESSAALEFTIDNSSAQGILMFGGFNFPAYGAATPGRIIITKRENAIDTDLLTDTYEAPPPSTTKYIMNVVTATGTNFDLGSSGFVNTTFGCKATGNSGRWVTNAGVARTVQRTTHLTIQLSTAGGCPGMGAIVFERIYDITAIFTG